MFDKVGVLFGSIHQRLSLVFGCKLRMTVLCLTGVNTVNVTKKNLLLQDTGFSWLLFKRYKWKFQGQRFFIGPYSKGPSLSWRGNRTY